MQFGPVQIPVAGLDWLAVAANCRRQGLGSHLLLAAERQMARAGILVGLLRTRAPRFFRRSGWAVCGRHSSSHRRRPRRCWAACSSGGSAPAATRACTSAPGGGGKRPA